ncbi:MAG TPA: hypothetical protein VFB92_01755 [Vicinamibacterales bacterium]|nr:hypothetical protein [Vicinamibacterales bacterium]
MRHRVPASAGVIALIALIVVISALLAGQSANESPAVSSQSAASRTPWGDPNLQGIWTDVYETPLQRPAKYAGRDFLTEDEVAALDQQRSAILRRDHREPKGSERDVSGAYNAVFETVKPTGRRTSLVIDPKDGRIPAYTDDARKRMDAYREFQLALMQATETCRKQEPTCRGWKFGPPSPKRAELPPMYNTDRLNRSDGPEDRSLAERCMAAILPDFSGYRRIVQSPGAVAIMYDTGQGQGWQRVIPVNGGPHLPAPIRQRFGDSRGRWDGNTLVVDVTNFGPKTDYRGSRQGLHLVERFTRLDATTLEYVVTIEDPSTWMTPWTVRQEMKAQDEQANRIYYEPRCHEGNFGLAGMLINSRAEERAFAQGRGPDPATRDNSTGGAGGGEGNTDPLAGGN